MEVQETRVQTDRVLTIPNILSMARLLGVPLFLWLILRPEFGGPKSDGWALLVLALSGVSDYLDGKLARRWNQISSLGRLLDPAADRLYILSTLVGLTWREILPLWLTAVLLAREAGSPGDGGHPPASRLSAPAGELPWEGSHLQPDVRFPVASAQ
ncbi:CDP-diacylglycerol--glycerol-3-phosphate 3-phosphatidyltransferase [Streptomyces hirsutus]